MRYDYDMAVIGGGAAGLVSAGMSASLGAKTVLIEAGKLGGDCTWTGCVPSKTLLKAAKVAHTVRTAARHGLESQEPQFDFARVMAHVHAVQQHFYEEADAHPNLEKFGIEIIEGRAEFFDPHRVQITNHRGDISKLTSRYFVVATGSGPLLPPVDGLSEIDYLTNETIFSLSTLPRRLIVVGSGPVGLEMAQAFRRFGAEVTVVSFDEALLVRDDRQLSAELQKALSSEGIRFFLSCTVKRVEKSGDGVRVSAEQRFTGKESVVEGDAVLFATGRRTNTSGLNLEAAGVGYNKTGIRIDNRCRTTRKNIFAAGDVTGRYQFTHMAEHMAKTAVANALLRFPAKLDLSHVTWCTFTDPEMAQVGAREDDLIRKGTRHDVYRFPFTKIDRAVMENETVGQIKVLAKSLTGKILGVSILGTNAGEMIGEYALAMRNGVTLRQVADTIHPYPTYVLGNRRAADQWYVRKITPNLIRWVRRIFGYRGRLPDPPAPERIL